MTGKTFEEIPVTILASGYRLALPVHRIVGAQPGPTLGVTSLIHGEEIVPISVQRRLYQELDPAQLRGTVLLLPVCNPFSYEAQTRYTPVDGFNLNRVFPGSRDGGVTEQIAYTLANTFVPRLDFLVDLHGGGVFPTVDYVYLSKLRPAMSFAFGSKLIYEGVTGGTTTLSGVSEGRNVPTMVAELGGGLVLDDRYIERGTRGVFNVMKHLGMLDGQPEAPAEQVVVKEMAVLHNHTGGALYPEVRVDKLGQIVPGGTVLGRVISPFTFEELEVLTAPFARNYMILARGSITRVNPGDYAYMCANADVV
jgi:predicted deacylase